MLAGSGTDPTVANPVQGDPPQFELITKMCAATVFPRLLGDNTPAALPHEQVGQETSKLKAVTALVKPSVLSRVKLKFPNPSAFVEPPAENPVPPAGQPPPVQPPLKVRLEKLTGPPLKFTSAACAPPIRYPA